METVATKVSFYQFSCVLEKVSKLNGEANKKKLLKSFVKQWREFEVKLRSSGDDNASFFPALRLLLPQLDKDREAYGIKEHSLAKLFIKIFGLGPKGPSALNLINYKTTQTNRDGIAGSDFATVAYFVLRDRCPEKGTLMISDVNKELDSIAMGHACKDHDRVQKSLLHLMKNVSSQELKWLIRIILKELRTGLGQRSIFHSYHSDAEEVYNVKMSLEKVCALLRDPNVRLHEIEVSLFSPFRPMLAQRESPFNVETVMKGKPYMVEVKYDGERMQLHVSEGTFRYFSRGGNEYTQTYGEDCYQGNLTPHISKQIDSSVKSCILDGEMVGYDPITHTIGSKGENFDIKSVHLGTYHPMFVVFDLLLLDGKILANVPLTERRNLLIDVVNELPGRIIISGVKEKLTNQDCIDALNEAIDKREEGIMIKDPMSIYKPNCRNKGGWFKIKPEYVVGSSDDLDLLVVGGYFGVGSSMVTHFLCAVAVDPGSGEDPKEFHTFSKVGTGYTIKELTELNQKLANDWLTFNKSNPPGWLIFPHSFRQKPDVVIRHPSKSIVFQVKATEIINSDQYKTNVTLRFPRVVKIRYDKPWYDCLTVLQLQQLKSKFDGKLVGTHLKAGGPEPKKRKGTVREKLTVDKKFCGIDAERVEKTSVLFDGKEMCIMSGDDRTSKQQLEEMVVENGGTIAQNPGEETFCVIAGKITLKVNNVIKTRNRDVVKIEWLLRCVKYQQLLPWLPMDMMHTSPKLKSSFATDYDCHGDSYCIDTEEMTLRIIFGSIKVAQEDLLSKEQIAEVRKKHFKHDNLSSLFQSCKAYFHNPSSLSSVLFKIHGGIVSPVVSDNVTHIVLPDKMLTDEEIQNSFRNMCAAEIVLEQWVINCIESMTLIKNTDI